MKRYEFLKRYFEMCAGCGVEIKEILIADEG
jgi:hypothetical protein